MRQGPLVNVKSGGMLVVYQFEKQVPSTKSYNTEVPSCNGQSCQN